MLAVIMGMASVGTMYAQVPLVFDTENRGATCTKPAMKLKSNTKLPDPFEWSDGSGRVSTCDDWSCRRNEIKAEIEYYEIGEKPAPPSNVTATYTGGTLTVKVTENGQTLTLTTAVSVPSGTGPFPVMITAGSSGLSSLLSGLIQCTFNTDQVVSYANGSGSRNLADPYYKLYPNQTASGKYSAWSWGISRLIDGLAIVKKAGTLNVDMNRIGVVGCSYAGKMALFAGAFDERIALTIAEESGGGGINSWRTSKEFNSRTGTNVEKIDNTNFSWFKQSMSSLDPYQLPYDHHELIAMIAPRAFLSLGNPDMVWLCDESGYKSLRAAHEVWKAFGVADRFGFDFEANHNHCSVSAQQQTNATKFIDRFLRGKTTVNTDLTSNPFASIDYKSWITWTTPAITCAPADPTIPVVTITEPANGAAAEVGAALTITATVADADNNVSKLEFLVDGVKVGEDLTSPYTVTWTATAKGSHTITVKATDAKSNTGSKDVAVTVTVPQTAFGGSPHPIPGTIQLEDFDEGGNGVAYYDGSAGSSVTPAVTYRSGDDVDIESCTDAGAGYNLGYTTAGEWTEYTVAVAASGTYDLTIRAAANGAGRTLILSSNGTDIAQNIAIPSTAGWQTWQDVVVKDIKLTAGVQVMRLTIGATDYINLNYMAFTSSSVSVPPVLTITAPATGSQFTDAQTIALSATATSAVSTITNVTFYDGTLLLGTDNTAPYSFDWTGMAAGTHTIRILAADAAGATTEKTVSVIITSIPVQKIVHLRKGWNIVGCPITGSTDIAKALSSIWAQVESVKNNDALYLKSNTSALNTLTKLDFGMGYMVKVRNDCDLDWSVQ